MYFVVDGCVAISKNGTTLAKMNSGDFFGERACLLHGVRNASADATMDTKVKLFFFKF